MSEIRRRTSKPKKDKADSKQPPLSITTTRSRSGPILLCFIAILSGTLFYVLRDNSTRVPSTYALCSRENNIYTMDETKPRTECLVVHHGLIADTGTISEIRKRWGDKDLTGPVKGATPASPKDGLKFYFVNPGSVIVPGLADAHGHILEYGFKMQLNLDGSKSVQEIVQRVRAYIEAHPDIKNDTLQWIQGFGWNQNLWSPSGEFPTASDLDIDPVLRGRRIALTRVDGHASWVSSAVLKIMEPLPETVDGGNIIRNEGGAPTGIFVDNATSLIPVPEWDFATMKKYFASTMKDAVAHGLTAIHDAGSPPEQIDFFKKMADQHMLPIQLYVMGRINNNTYWGDKIPRLHNYGGRLTVRSVKLVSDGALGSWGAAMIEPYSDNPSTRGLLLVPPDILSSQVHQFLNDDWQVNIHCIGDQANKNALDIFEKVLKDRNSSAVRPRIEHAQIMRLFDLERIGKLGVIPSVQPTHATSDMDYAELRIGPERIKGAYAYQTLLQNSQGHILPIGSDFPIESIDPLKGFYAAVTRLSPQGTSPQGTGGWYPAERLTRMQALKGMTYDAAFAAFAEQEYGSIGVGLHADVVVFDRDIMVVPVEDILKSKVTATIVNGEVVYGSIS